MKKTVILLLIIFSAIYAENNNSFGIKASNISGYGAFYRRVVTERISVQIGGVYYMLETKDEKGIYSLDGYTFGGEVQYNMNHWNNNRVYISFGGYYYTNKEIVGDDSIKNIDSYNTGLGLGYEHYFDRVFVGGEAGYKVYVDYGETWDEGEGWRDYVRKQTKPGLGAHIGFTF